MDWIDIDEEMFCAEMAVRVAELAVGDESCVAKTPFANSMMIETIGLVEKVC